MRIKSIPVKCAYCKTLLPTGRWNRASRQKKVFCNRECQHLSTLWYCYRCGKKCGQNRSGKCTRRYCSMSYVKTTHGLSKDKYFFLVHTSTYALKKLLNLPTKQIPKDFRIALFATFKLRRKINENRPS